MQDIPYKPVALEDEEADERDMEDAILAAVDELAACGPGDVLVFLSGEREIRQIAEALRKHHPPSTEVLPLYARLTAEEQMRVFRPHQGRRIVLATNVAETSLTVPGIRYVVDPGFARISRYGHRTKVQRLPIEAISRASVDQRAGRCGRVAPGVCIRLYDEKDYQSRDRFTEPEILRTKTLQPYARPPPTARRGRRSTGAWLEHGDGCVAERGCPRRRAVRATPRARCLPSPRRPVRPAPVAGRRQRTTDSAGGDTRYEYDPAGRLSKLRDAANAVLIEYLYNPAGRLRRVNKGNGTYTTYDYDAAGQLLHLTNCAPGGSVNSRFDSTYDSRGRRRVMQTLEGDWTYDYDGSGQLTHAVFASSDPSIPSQDLQYKYDTLGNRRGIWSPIGTNVPGIEVTELFPLQAKIADRFSIVRSLHHDSGDHFTGGHWMLTGRGGVSGANTAGKYPFFGSIATRVIGARQPGMPANVAVPYAMSIGLRPGYFGGNYLGPQDNPFETEGDPSAANFQVRNIGLQGNLTIEGLENRRQLLSQIDTARRAY